MIRRILADHGGATAVEFALVSPFLLLAVVFVLQFGIGVQRWTALQAVSEATARCVAIAAPGCQTPNADASYAIQLAADRGVPGVTAGMIAIANGTVSGVAVQNVTITYPFNVAGLTANLTAAGSFPIP